MPRYRAIFEAAVTVPGAGWTATVNGNLVTITGGTKYPIDILAEFFTAIAPFLTGEAQSTDDDGFLTLSASANWTCTWGSTDLRDMLGYAANLSGQSTYAASTAMRGVWFPDSPLGGDTFDPQVNGHEHSDEQTVYGPRGEQATFNGNSYKSHRGIVLSHVSRGKALHGVSTGVVSYQTWVRESLRGGIAYFTVTAAGARPNVRVQWNVPGTSTFTNLGESGSNGVYSIRLMSDLELTRPAPGYTGYYSVTIPELVKV